MNSLYTDTHPDVRSVQDAILRRMSAQEKVRIVSSMTRTMIYHARRSIRRSHPDLTDREIDLRFVELHYGEDLARGMRASRARSPGPSGGLWRASPASSPMSADRRSRCMRCRSACIRGPIPGRR